MNITTKTYTFPSCADFARYDGARHEILNETNRKEVYVDILKFLNGLL